MVARPHFHRTAGVLAKRINAEGRAEYRPLEWRDGLKSISLTGYDRDAGIWWGWTETQDGKGAAHREVHDRGGSDEPRPK